MEKHLTDYLNTFPVPDDYIDSQCLICLENFEPESGNKFIRLPCECSNSIFHISCIIKWIMSGSNKNYCVQCKKEFELPEFNSRKSSNNLTNSTDLTNQNITTNLINDITSVINLRNRLERELNISDRENNNILLRISLSSVVHPENNSTISSSNNSTVNSSNILELESLRERIEREKNNIKMEYTSGRLFNHVIFNVTVNLINFAYICGMKTNVSQRILAMFYFLKILSNFVIASNFNKNTDAINFGIMLGCMSQFILIMMTLIINKSINNHPLLVYSQILFLTIDIIVATILNYYCSIKIQNVVFNLSSENQVSNQNNNQSSNQNNNQSSNQNNNEISIQDNNQVLNQENSIVPS